MSLSISCLCPRLDIITVVDAFDEEDNLTRLERVLFYFLGDPCVSRDVTFSTISIRFSVDLIGIEPVMGT